MSGEGAYEAVFDHDPECRVVDDFVTEGGKLDSPLAYRGLEDASPAQADIIAWCRLNEPYHQGAL